MLYQGYETIIKLKTAMSWWTNM